MGKWEHEGPSTPFHFSSGSGTLLGVLLVTSAFLPSGPWSFQTLHHHRAQGSHTQLAGWFGAAVERGAEWWVVGADEQDGCLTYASTSSLPLIMTSCVQKASAFSSINVEMTPPTSVDECHRCKGMAVRKALPGCPGHINSFPYEDVPSFLQENLTLPDVQ